MIPSLLLLAAGAAQAASAWGFDDGTLSIVAKKSGETIKERYATILGARSLT
jgi:oligosaccharyltransferase complex subunit delta (ribophorin II)